MADLIDREKLKAAMYHRAFETDGDTMWQSGCWVRYRAIEAVINGQPSAQPELDEWCTDCKEYDQEKHSCPRFNRVIRETLADMRERGTGKWLDLPFLGMCECSNCGCVNPATTYCPECGSKNITRCD